jgi:hypothetical protein
VENLGIFYDHLIYFTAIRNILWPFGIFCGNLVHFSPFWYFGQRKICATLEQTHSPLWLAGFYVPSYQIVAKTSNNCFFLIIVFISEAFNGAGFEPTILCT